MNLPIVIRPGWPGNNDRHHANAPGGNALSTTVDTEHSLLEAEDIAKLLHMTTGWVYGEVRANRIPHVRLGRYVRFRPEAIDAWLASREAGGTEHKVARSA